MTGERIEDQSNGKRMSRCNGYDESHDKDYCDASPSASLKRSIIIESYLGGAADALFSSNQDDERCTGCTRVLLVESGTSDKCSSSNNQCGSSGNSRNKRVKTDATKKYRVSFNDVLDIFACSPYEKGRADSETIELFRNDIWYTVR